MSSSNERVWTVLSMLKWGTGYFKKNGVDSPRLSMEWLLSHVLDIRRLDIYLQFDRPLSSEELDELRPLIKRRATHEPLQYITGSTDFLGCVIRVNSSVLIPRQETEQLAELILERHRADLDKDWSVLDIGTGSGCIPMALKKHAPAWNCTGIDISDQALDTAVKNAELNGLDIFFLKADLFELNNPDSDFRVNPNMVISNPPYITPGEKSELDPQVIKYEPASALFHENPLKVYEEIAAYAAGQDAILYLECNHKLAGEIQTMVHSYYQNVELIKDLDQNDRFIAASGPL